MISPGAPPIVQEKHTPAERSVDGCNLFVFHIPNYVTNRELYAIFCEFGEIVSVRIITEHNTGRSRGFGFVSYRESESAKLAIDKMNGYAIGSKRLTVQLKKEDPVDNETEVEKDLHNNIELCKHLKSTRVYSVRDDGRAREINIDSNPAAGTDMVPDETTFHPTESEINELTMQDHNMYQAMEKAVGGLSTTTAAPNTTTTPSARSKAEQYKSD